MAPLILEGETLGQRHRYYNKLLNELTTKGETGKVQKINYDEPDIDNIFKIDIASKNKDVEYILEVLKSDDMLYVSRAIKRSIWLISDSEYSHIINPDYIHTILLPQMTLKAGNKLLLTVRLNLKDEKRVEDFYAYYEKNNKLETALNWLPNCSSSFIETVVAKHGDDIPPDLFKRLFEKSFTVLEIAAKKINSYRLRYLLSKSTFLLNKNPEKYFAILNAVEDKYFLSKFSPKSTRIIMKTCPDIILKNFEKFIDVVDIPTFASILNKEDIKTFLKKHVQNKNLKKWFTFDNLKPFLARMPSKERMEFIKEICIEKSSDKDSEIVPYCDDVEADTGYGKCAAMSLMCQAAPSSNANIYKWYIFVPFSTAFNDLKKIIRAESNPTERNAMFAILTTCARSNPQNIQTLLRYYRDKHINEPFKFKSHFVNIVLSNSLSHRFDENTWSILNDIFCSMEVYSENENNVQTCLKHIILYKVVHNLGVPDIVENKFQFDTLKTIQNKLNENEKDKVFHYLYKNIVNKIQNITIKSKLDLKEAKNIIINILNLLRDWKKNIVDYPIILEKIRLVVTVNVEKSWNENLSDIYNVNKSWRKNMFKESLDLHPTAETFHNALKHGPEVLTAAKENINNAMLLTPVFSKLRIYWPETLANIFEIFFIAQLKNTTKHKTSIQGLCILLPRKKLVNLICQYTPTDTKINWGETDEMVLSIRKYFGKFMYLARPQLPVEIVLSYAKGDYLQFTLPSIQSILFNMSADQSLKHVPTLLDAPVSLQKHGLKFAYAKLKTVDLLTTLIGKWKSTKNASIRATIFKLVFDLMGREKDENNIKEIWLVLDTFIDNLKPDENKNIYITLGQADKVPKLVKIDYCIKAYRFLKSLPPQTNCETVVDSVVRGMLDVIEFLDTDIASEILFDSFEKKFGEEYYERTHFMSQYLLSCKFEITQTQRYEKIFVPLLSKYLALLKLKNKRKKQYHLKYNFNKFLIQLQKDLKDIVLEEDMIIPTKLFNDICGDLEKNFSHEEYYVMILTWKLSAEYMKLVDKYRPKLNISLTKNEDDNDEGSSSKWDKLCLEAAPHFGKICMDHLKRDMKNYYPSIYLLFSKALSLLFDRFLFNCRFQVIKAILAHADTNEGHLLVLKILPKYIYNKNDKKKRLEICQKISSHPSPEVRMFRYQSLQKYEENEKE